MRIPFSVIFSLNGVIYVFSVRSHSNAEQTFQEVKKEVEQHLKEKEILENSLPPSIVIGPFFVRVEAVRQALSKKRKSLANAMVDLLASKLRKQVDEVSHLLRFQKTLKYLIIVYPIHYMMYLSVLIFFEKPTYPWHFPTCLILSFYLMYSTVCVGL